MDLLVTLDNVAYETKPSPQEFASITNRLKRAGGVEIGNAAFCEHVRKGKSWMGGVYEAAGNGQGSFIGQQVFGLDFDNTTEILDGGGTPLRDGDNRILKRPLKDGDPGYLDPLCALRRCYENELYPLCLYWTFSATLEPLHHRYRIVLVMDRLITDQGEAEEIIKGLLSLFPEADQKCKNVNRLFLGSSGNVCNCWEVNGDGQS